MRNQRGLSLIELMIAITLGLVLIGGVVQMFLSSRVVFSTQQSLSRVQETGRFAVEFMAHDVRMAGYFGCASRDTAIVSDIPSDFWNNFVTPPMPERHLHSIEGFTAETLPSEAQLVPAPLPNTDILVVRYAAGIPHILADDAVPGIIEVRAAGVIPVANCANGLCVDANMIITNCAAGRLFRASGIVWQNDVTTITHGGSWPNPDGEVINPFEVFQKGHEVQPVNTVVFYTALSDEGRPNLYRRESGGQAVAVLEGVEDLNFRYRIESDYFSADELNGPVDWLAVDAVLIEVLAQGNEDNVLEAPQGYVFGGENVAPPADRRVRQVFSTLVTIRSREREAEFALP